MSSHGTASTLPRRALAEFIGTALLVAAVIGSGIAAARLSPHDAGLQLLENTAVAVVRLLYPTIAEVAASVVVPHTGSTGHPENIGGRSG
jgi:glycerol uptake facilitator-like aquaporin